MHALVIFLSLVAPPTDPQPTIPIGSTRPEDGGLYFYGGSLIGSRTRNWLGCGWTFANGCSIEVASNGATYRRPYFETEVYRFSVFAGTDLGVRQERYLGYGLVSALDLGLGTSTFSLVWFPTDFMSFSFDLDPLRCQFAWGWRLNNNP